MKIYILAKEHGLRMMQSAEPVIQKVVIILQHDILYFPHFPSTVSEVFTADEALEDQNQSEVISVDGDDQSRVSGEDDSDLSIGIHNIKQHVANT